jgi:hypothetical protein
MAPYDTPQDPQQELHQALPANPATLIRDALMRELLCEVDHEGRVATRLAHLSRALVDKGSGGDVAAIREVFDRTAGKTLPASPASETEPQTVTFEWRRHDDECAT